MPFMFRNRYDAQLRGFRCEGYTNGLFNRRNSQKPNEELYASFKRDFPEVGSGTILNYRSACRNGPRYIETEIQFVLNMLFAINYAFSDCYFSLHCRNMAEDEPKNQDRISNLLSGSVSFMPSLVDVNPAFAKQSFAYN